MGEVALENASLRTHALSSRTNSRPAVNSIKKLSLCLCTGRNHPSLDSLFILKHCRAFPESRINGLQYSCADNSCWSSIQYWVQSKYVESRHQPEYFVRKPAVRLRHNSYCALRSNSMARLRPYQLNKGARVLTTQATVLVILGLARFAHPKAGQNMDVLRRCDFSWVAMYGCRLTQCKWVYRL